jgi:segregation and condensation protein B
MSDDVLDNEEFLEPLETLGRDESRRALYALLFVSDRPVSAARLSEALGDMDSDIVANLLEELKAELNSREELPYELHEIAGGYQLAPKPVFAPYIRRFLQVKKSGRLSKALLETLAVIAYKQPVTRAEVEAIRGVSVSYAFDQLQEKRLIKISGIAELPGRPKLYRTTDEFLVSFGLKSIKELPSLDELRVLD